ncbi:MAG TPA: ATP-binding protein [Anaerolineales bacterium]
MPKNISRKRVEKLFSEIQQLSSDSNGHLPENQPVLTKPLGSGIQSSTPALLFQEEIDILQARVLELEARLKESEKHVTSTPIIYEKEEVGFAYAGDKVMPIRGTQQLVQNEADVIKTPLTSSGRAIGEVQVAQPSERPLTHDDIKLANTIAQQASLQIENLRLLAAAERARAEAEEATHQLTHKNWETFLDAIHNSERIGYAYDQASVEPFTNPAPADFDHEETMQVLDQQIGRFFVKGKDAVSREDKALISAVVKQVGQQMENIRLLADAARARADAEAATRRLTRENWQSYAEQNETETLGFVYDSNIVTPIGSIPIPYNNAFEQPLVVQGESIGQLKVMGMQNISTDARGLAASIAAQASIHLETLRLNEELQKRARELQELDRLKSAFLANMSHELRTPLNSILGFTDVMLEGLDGELTDYMDNDLRLIQKNGQHLLHLINDVLDMAKIESGRMNLNPENFRIHDIFDDVNSITSSLANARNTELIIDEKSDGEAEIYADSTRVKQVMINLVNNAIKFTTNGKITMSVSRMDGARVLISVKDTGLGIPSDHLEAIFQEFTQVDTSTTRKVGGTGLGLPISRRLIEMHGGRLWAESTGVEGEGSTFFIEMPLQARITEVIEKQEK